MERESNSTLIWWKAWVTYLLNCLRCDNGGDGASLLHNHTLLMTRVHLLPMQVTGSWLSVCLHTNTSVMLSSHYYTTLVWSVHSKNTPHWIHEEVMHGAITRWRCCLRVSYTSVWQLLHSYLTALVPLWSLWKLFSWMNEWIFYYNNISYLSS